MNSSQLLVFLQILILSVLVSCNSDSRLFLCGDACLQVGRPDSTTPPEQVEKRIATASENLQSCTNTCVSLYTESDTRESLVQKLSKIPFEELFRPRH